MNIDKQPQTVYVPFDLNSERVLSYSGKKIENVYIHTTEELEALLQNERRWAAKKTWEAAIDVVLDSSIDVSIHSIFKPNTKEQYLNKHYPLPQPPKK